MASTAECPASSDLPRTAGARRCTDVVRIFHATSMDVMIAGQNCSIEFHSPFGTTRILIPTGRFIEVARGDRDSNRNPFPHLSATLQRDTLRLLEEDAAEARTSISAPPPPPTVRIEPAALFQVHATVADAVANKNPVTVAAEPGKRTRRPNGSVALLCQQGWLAWRTNPKQRTSAIARSVGVTQATLTNYFNEKHGDEYDKLRAGLVVAKPIPKALAEISPLPPRNQERARNLALRQAWQFYISDPSITLDDIASQLGGYTCGYSNAFARFAAEPGAPKLKPNGKL